MTDEERFAFEGRLRVLLPETYQVFDDEVQPSSMGSAGLKFGPDGKVLWDAMWRSFCHLAMAGGPPHRGKLLEPPALTTDAALTPAYTDVAEEICRGISLVTGLCAEASPLPGWIQMYCTSAAMTGWLMRAIVMENVTAVGIGLALYLPTGPAFRVEKEIKNVITSVAKSCHYWQDHMSEAKHDEIATLLRRMEQQRALIAPNLYVEAEPEALAGLAEHIGEAVHAATGFLASRYGYVNWIGIDCQQLPAAIWIMRALAMGNTLARREGTIVFVPLNPSADPEGAESIQAVIEAHRLAQAYQVL